MSKYLKLKNDSLLNQAKEYGKVINKDLSEIIESAIAFYLSYQVHLLSEIKPAHDQIKEISVDESLSVVEKLVKLDSLYYEKTGIYFPNLHNHIINQKDLLLKEKENENKRVNS